jgi:DNA-binding MarR family transcriptional regulator
MRFPYPVDELCGEPPPHPRRARASARTHRRSCGGRDAISPHWGFYPRNDLVDAGLARRRAKGHRRSGADRHGAGVPAHEIALGDDAATRIRTLRLILLLAQELGTLMDQQLREDGLTTQQAVLITIIDTLGEPSIKQAAAALGTTHQNIRQLAASLERKGFIRITPDDTDARVRRLATTPKSHSTWQRRSAADQQQVLEWFSELSRQSCRSAHISARLAAARPPLRHEVEALRSAPVRLRRVSSAVHDHAPWGRLDRWRAQGAIRCLKTWCATGGRAPRLNVAESKPFAGSIRV